MSKVKIDVTEEPTGSEGQEEPKDVQDLTGFVSQFDCSYFSFCMV